MKDLARSSARYPRFLIWRMNYHYVEPLGPSFEPSSVDSTDSLVKPIHSVPDLLLMMPYQAQSENVFETKCLRKAGGSGRNTYSRTGACNLSLALS